jgi:hypothetical protein
MASAIQARKRGVRSWLLILLALNKIAIRPARAVIYGGIGEAWPPMI